MRHNIFPTLIAAGILSMVLVGCGQPKPQAQTGMPQPGEEGPPIPKQEYSIKAQEGGSIALKQSDGSRVRIIFPQGALEKDAAIEVGERTERGPEIASGGFSLNQKGSDQGPALKYPALIAFSFDKELNKDVSIVRLKDGGDYEIIPTRVSVKNGKTSLVAQVDHFSDYGTRYIDPAAGEKAKQDQKASDFNWVIYVKDSADANMGAMQRKITLDFKVVNTSGDIGGTYTGYAHATTNNDMEAMGGKMDADFQIKDDGVSFELAPYVELADLVEREDGLANLEPEKLPDFFGNGVLHMSGSGVATGRIGAYGGSRAVDAESSSDAFTVAVTGPLVRLSVDITGVGTMYFDGFIRGEGR